MHFRENKEEYIRKAVFALLILFTAVIQNTGRSFPSIFGVKGMLLIPLTVSIAMFSEDIGGLGFGLLAGTLWDFYCPHFDGFYAILLTGIGFITGYLVKRYMRNGFLTALFFTGISSFVTGTLYWLIFVVFVSAKGSLPVYVKSYLTSIALTTLITPVYYFLIKLINEKHRKEEEISTEQSP